jgi:hypothetical protein
MHIKSNNFLILEQMPFLIKFCIQKNIVMKNIV